MSFCQETDSFLSVCIPLIEARGARAAASLSSWVKLMTITQSVTGIRAVWLSKLKLNIRISVLQTAYINELLYMKMFSLHNTLTVSILFVFISCLI